MKHIFHILTVAATFLIPNNVVADDSIPSTSPEVHIEQEGEKTLNELNELVVVAKRGWVENGAINIIPSKQEKNLSNSPASLIGSMNLPFIKEKDGAIVNLAGDNVKIFINGEKADDIDISTFWSNHVKKVQYIENPNDPNYLGETAVVNFVMTKYEVGGITSLDLSQNMPCSFTSSSIASKLVVKKMSYGARVSGTYFNHNRISSEGETDYYDIFLITSNIMRLHAWKISVPITGMVTCLFQPMPDTAPKKQESPIHSPLIGQGIPETAQKVVTFGLRIFLTQTHLLRTAVPRPFHHKL